MIGFTLLSSVPDSSGLMHLLKSPRMTQFLLCSFYAAVIFAAVMLISVSFVFVERLGVVDSEDESIVGPQINFFSAPHQSSLTSFRLTQKSRKMKNPCKPLVMENSQPNTLFEVGSSVTERGIAKPQESPSKTAVIEALIK